ncbi:MAG: hypothetical protein JNM24_07425 [Bdellovibrionaceae bacterium]|nr:hypothetical protein [Pseudobdellovibrionaceae bacterium]
MAKTSKKLSDKTSKTAAPVRDFLKKILKKHINTLEDRRALAEFLGHSQSSVGNLLRGEGSLDTWIAVVCYYYKIDGEKLLEIVQNFDSLMKKYQPTESDKIASQIKLEENKRKALFSALLTAVRIIEED